VARFAPDDKSMMRWLLEHGADPNVHDENGFCALDTADTTSSTDTILFLLDNGADTRQSFPLHSALERRREYKKDIIPVMTILLDHGADIDALESQRPAGSPRRAVISGILGTALYKAVRKNNLEAVKLLVERGVDKHKLGERGESPPALAKRLGKMDIYEVLVPGGLP
jgi:ankyrin repeat protein